ncbi:hypothetical protein NC651_040151 [Populus alba x Populus x berolinensis]|nr:hypothetical protein NC651_040151 [Populus alba x Populus x berolinensis]
MSRSTGEYSFTDIITSIRYWVIHSITIPSLFIVAMTQSNPNKQNVELNCISLY